MTQTAILRHEGPHRVQVPEGSRDASRVRPTDSGPHVAEIPIALHDVHLAHAPGSAADSARAQLSGIHADPKDVWFGDADLAERIHRLSLKNAQLSQDLSRASQPGHIKEDHE